MLLGSGIFLHKGPQPQHTLRKNVLACERSELIPHCKKAYLCCLRFNPPLCFALNQFYSLGLWHLAGTEQQEQDLVDDNPSLPFVLSGAF